MVQIRRISAFCALLGITLTPIMATAQDGSSKAPKITQAVRADFQDWLVDVRAEARDKGISERVISSALSNIEPVARILERDGKQSE